MNRLRARWAKLDTSDRLALTGIAGALGGLYLSALLLWLTGGGSWAGLLAVIATAGVLLVAAIAHAERKGRASLHSSNTSTRKGHP